MTQISISLLEKTDRVIRRPAWHLTIRSFPIPSHNFPSLLLHLHLKDKSKRLKIQGVSSAAECLTLKM